MSKHKFYLNLAREISKQSHCLRGNFGAVIVKHDMVLGIGYNGPARGVKHCEVCRRESEPSGLGYDKCIAVHAEANAVIQAGGRMHCLGATLYLGTHNRPLAEQTNKYNEGMGYFSCGNCARLMVNAGIIWFVQEETAGYIAEYDLPLLVQEGKLF